MSKKWFAILLTILVLAACSKGEKANDLAALMQRKPTETKTMGSDQIKELIACCDENARAMGAECCQQLESLMKKQMDEKTKGEPNQAGGMVVKSGRPVKVDEAIIAQWPQVKLQVGPKNGKLQEIVVGVGEKKQIAGTPLEVEVLNFVPNFKMSEAAIISDGAEPNNPAARLVVRQTGKPDWSGWLFAKMPDVHAFEHDTYKLLLVAGVPKESGK